MLAESATPDSSTKAALPELLRRAARKNEAKRCLNTFTDAPKRKIPNSLRENWGRRYTPVYQPTPSREGIRGDDTSRSPGLSIFDPVFPYRLKRNSDFFGPTIPIWGRTHSCGAASESPAWITSEITKFPRGRSGPFTGVIYTKELICASNIHNVCVWSNHFLNLVSEPFLLPYEPAKIRFGVFVL